MCDHRNNIHKSPINSLKCTTPSNFKVKNPFDKVLISKLHKSICSPGMCKKYKQDYKGSFEWDIHQKCELAPADIVVCNSQFEPSPDPILEKIAEEAVDKFFSQEKIVPSPLDVPVKSKPLAKSSHEESMPIDYDLDKETYIRDASAQTILTLPIVLPAELEKLLEKYFTFNQDQQALNDSSANASLRRKLYFEEHSVASYDSDDEQEMHPSPIVPGTTYKPHTPLRHSPHVSRDVLSQGMRRTFYTPVNSSIENQTSKIKSKMFSGVELGELNYSPIEGLRPGSSLTCVNISPVQKVMSSSEDEKNNFTSPESEVMASCLNCVSNSRQTDISCYCKTTPNKSLLRRSKSFKDSYRQSMSSLWGKRSASMSSLNRSRSVQKLDFSGDMSVDEESLRCHSELAGSESSVSPQQQKECWKMEMSRIEKILDNHEPQNKTQEEEHQIKDTPVKGKHKSEVLSHVISRILSDKSDECGSPMQMSLNSSLEDEENPLYLEDKRLNFDNIDLQLLTNNIDKAKQDKMSFKRIDSGFNKNSFFNSKSIFMDNKSSVSDNAKYCNTSALKELSNTHRLRVVSGFKDDTSSDSVQFYGENLAKKPFFNSVETAEDNKENVFQNFEKFLECETRPECSSASELFVNDMAFNCNSKNSSTPSKQTYSKR